MWQLWSHPFVPNFQFVPFELLEYWQQYKNHLLTKKKKNKSTWFKVGTQEPIFTSVAVRQDHWDSSSSCLLGSPWPDCPLRLTKQAAVDQDNGERALLPQQSKLVVCSNYSSPSLKGQKKISVLPCSIPKTQVTDSYSESMPVPLSEVYGLSLKEQVFLLASVNAVLEELSHRVLP